MSYPPPMTITDWMVRTKDLDHSYQITQQIIKDRKGRSTKSAKTKKTVRAINVESTTVDINKLSVKERQELQDKGLCFRCRKSGHIARNCPSKSRNSGKPVTRKVRQVIQEDSEEDNGPEVDEEDDEESLQLNALRATDFDSDF